MLMFLLSRLLTGWFTFLLPSYSTFKALRQRPLNEREIEKRFGYWIVIGAVVAFEYTAEWLLSWFPFYWEIKTLVLLFLSLPQFEGSTYIYKAYVEPYLVQNESEIDATIASARNETLQFLQLRLSALWDILYSLLNKTPIPSRGDSTNGSPLVDQNALFQSVQGLWGTISPVSFLAALAPGSGNPTDSRSASDTFESAKQAPSLSPPTAASATVGYDIGESRNN